MTYISQGQQKSIKTLWLFLEAFMGLNLFLTRLDKSTILTLFPSVRVDLKQKRNRPKCICNEYKWLQFVLDLYSSFRPTDLKKKFLHNFSMRSQKETLALFSVISSSGIQNTQWVFQLKTTKLSVWIWQIGSFGLDKRSFTKSY